MFWEIAVFTFILFYHWRKLFAWYFLENLKQILEWCWFGLNINYAGNKTTRLNQPPAPLFPWLMPRFFMKINHNVSSSPSCNINEFSPTTNKTMSSNCFSRSILYQTITTNTIKMPHCFFTSTKPAGSSPRLPYSSESQLPTSSLCKANRITPFPLNA